MEDQIRQVIDKEVRPMLQRDGGDLNLIGVKGNEVTIEYRGACGCCPHAAMGTLRFIEAVLKERVDEKLTVKMA